MHHDDFATEPVRGLPETPPEGECILWQGRPNSWALAREALNLKWVAGYFVVLVLWRFLAVVDLMPLGQAIGAAVPIMILGAIALGLLYLIAYVQARATVYTITNRRVAMRIGAALTMTLNLPYSQIASADLARRRDGTGTISFQTLGKTRLSYLVCWPHVRPWKMNPTQPALRCIPEADRIATLLGEAAMTRITDPRVERRAQTDTPARGADAGAAVAAE
ncbi:PH domain-containing protein [Roseivivax lentus]|uniref:PH domain-containing protein n=1 Tax=Roseivivax lentus TaxID=633194 RepID=A0A1N7JM48_9RHOB|nr:photosynthetic complex putative assembly protein PuhB [Roseivivax lentus]SIS50385.1 PH domain-containing protein [Roseivivax lentus]